MNENDNAVAISLPFYAEDLAVFINCFGLSIEDLTISFEE